MQQSAERRLSAASALFGSGSMIDQPREGCRVRRGRTLYSAILCPCSLPGTPPKMPSGPRIAARPCIHPDPLRCGAIRVHVRIARHTERHPPWPCQLAQTSGMAHGHSGRESDGTNEGLAGRHGGDGRTPTRRSTRIAQEAQFGRTEGDIYLSIELSIDLSIYSL